MCVLLLCHLQSSAVRGQPICIFFDSTSSSSNSQFSVMRGQPLCIFLCYHLFVFQQPNLHVKQSTGYPFPYSSVLESNIPVSTLPAQRLVKVATPLLHLHFAKPSQDKQPEGCFVAFRTYSQSHLFRVSRSCPEQGLVLVIADFLARLH